MSNLDTILDNPIPDFDEPKSKKGRGGRRSISDRMELESNSETYKSKQTLEKMSIGNPNGANLFLFRLSYKNKKSEGDLAQRKEVYEKFINDGHELNKIEEIWEVGSAWKQGKYRKVIDDILKRIRNREIANIYAYEVSRLTRDGDVAKIIQQAAQLYNVPIRFVKQPSIHPEKKDAFNEIQYVIAVQQAYEESLSTSDRTKRNHRFRAEMGRKRGGSEPMGMKTIRAIKTDNGYVKTDNNNENGYLIFARNDEIRSDYPQHIQTESKLVEMIYKWALENKSCQYIAKEINKMNIPTFGAEHWKNQTIRAILRNPIYAGYGTYNKKICLEKIDKNGNQSGNPVKSHLGFISEDDWHKVQEIMDSRKTNKKSVSKNYKLAGSIICEKCGNKMTGNPTYIAKKGKKIINPAQYICRTRIDNPEKCNGNRIHLSYIEDTIKWYISYLIENPKNLANKNKTINENWDIKISDLQERIDKMNLKISLTDDLDDKIAFNNRLDSLNDELKMMVDYKLLEEKDNAPIKYTVEDFINLWDSDDNLTIQRIIKRFFAGIYIYPAKDKIILNNHQINNKKWLANYYRIDIEYHNGYRFNLAEEIEKLDL